MRGHKSSYFSTLMLLAAVSASSAYAQDESLQENETLPEEAPTLYSTQGTLLETTYGSSASSGTYISNLTVTRITVKNHGNGPWLSFNVSQSLNTSCANSDEWKYFVFYQDGDATTQPGGQMKTYLSQLMIAKAADMKVAVHYQCDLDGRAVFSSVYLD